MKGVMSYFRQLSCYGIGAVCLIFWTAIPPASYAMSKEDSFSGNTYVILTNISETDPYFEAVERLRQFRSAEVVFFTPGRLGEMLEPIRRLAPRNVAFVMRPDSIDLNLAFEAFEFSTQLDDDPFPDYAYGFITGATAADAVQLVKNTMEAESEIAEIPRKIFGFGPSDIPQVDDGSEFEWAVGWQGSRLDHKPGTFPKEHLNQLSSNAVIRFWGHGSPDSVENGLVSDDLAGVDLFPAVVFAGPCYSAVVSKSYVQHDCNSEVEEQSVAPEDSLALAFIRSGATGYFAALDEDFCISAGQEMEYALTTGLPLGMVAKRALDNVVMGFGDAPVSLPRLRPGKKRPDTNAVEWALQRTASRILFGDPAGQLLPKVADYPFSIESRRTSTGMNIQLSLDNPLIHSLLIDAHHDNLCDCASQNDILYVVTELPHGFGEVADVEHAPFPRELKGVKHSEVQWKEEDWFGRRLLHLQIQLKHDSLADSEKGTRIQLTVREILDN